MLGPVLDGLSQGCLRASRGRCPVGSELHGREVSAAGGHGSWPREKREDSTSRCHNLNLFQFQNISQLQSPLPNSRQISPSLLRKTSSTPSHHLTVGFPCKYLGTFLNTVHPHVWGLWQCVLGQAAGSDGGLRQGLSCLAAPPALMPRAGWVRPGGSPRSYAPPEPPLCPRG